MTTNAYMLQVINYDGSVNFSDHGLKLQDKDSLFDSIVQASETGQRVKFLHMETLEVLREEFVCTHTLKVRIITEDGELVLEDIDFSEDAAYDWFAENVRQAQAGEIVQLIDTSDDRVLAEEVVA